MSPSTFRHSPPNSLFAMFSLLAVPVVIWMLLSGPKATLAEVVGGVLVIYLALLAAFSFRAADRAKRARRELELSEQRFRTVFEMAPDGAMLLSPGGRIEMVNCRLEHLVGYPREQLLGRSVEELLAESEREKYRQFIQDPKECLEKKCIRPEPVQLRHADGTTFPVEVTFSPIENGAKFPLMVSLRDVRAQAASREKLEMQALLLDWVGEAVIATDRHGLVTFWNRAAETTYGWTAEEAMGQQVLELTPAETSKQQAAEILESLGTSDRWSGRFQVRRRDGSPFWATVTDAVIRDERGEITSFVGVSRDATDEFRQEQEPRLRDQRMNMVGQATRDVVWDLDPVAGTLWWGNEITTLTGEEAPGDLEWWKERIHPVERDEVSRSLEEAIRGDAERWTAEYRFRRHDDSWVSIFDRAWIIRNEDGVAERVVGTMMDISERKTLEEELRRAERLASLGRLAATVSHEFNNVLMGIQPFADLLARTAVDARHERIAKQITGSVSRGRRITHDILKFTRPTEPDLRPLDLGEWLETVLPEWQAVLGESVWLAIETDEGNIRVEGDRNQLEQLMSNLLMNARDAIEGEGTVTVRVTRPAAGATYGFGAIASPEGFAHIAVVDSGGGVPDEILGHIFEPLFTTRRDGTGLGLAFCHQIVQQHGGLIFAENNAGAGATIHVFLPIASSDAETQSNAWRILRSDEGRERIAEVVLIEDDSQVTEGLRAILELEGIAVRSAASGAAGLEELAIRRPDVVILDVGLPDISGVELFQIIELRYPGLRIVFSSGHQDLGALEQFLRPGVEFLRKPYELDTLLRALERVASHEPPERELSD
ncbi:MAG: PAS domain S-box protein [Thermoanaerobaculia bacterium]